MATMNISLTDPLKQLIAEGLASGPSAPLPPDHFDKLRERARNRK